MTALLRRADAAAVLVAALAAKAARPVGFRRIAAELAPPAETVGGWLRRFAGRAEAVRAVFTVWLVAVDADPVMSSPASGAIGDAVAWDLLRDGATQLRSQLYESGTRLS